jgi:hypothetical protein
MVTSNAGLNVHTFYSKRDFEAFFLALYNGHEDWVGLYLQYRGGSHLVWQMGE